MARRVLAISLVLALARGRLVSNMRGGGDRRGSPLALLRGGAGDDQLAERTTLEWPKARPWLKYVRRHGVLQFISLYNQRKNDTAEELQWGDEIEYQLIAYDDEAPTPSTPSTPSAPSAPSAPSTSSAPSAPSAPTAQAAL